MLTRGDRNELQFHTNITIIYRVVSRNLLESGSKSSKMSAIMVADKENFKMIVSEKR